MAGQENYEVGYGKPPREHRFQKGRSGNPKGRPKGRRNIMTEIREVLGQQIKMTSGGQAKQVSATTAILMKLVEKAGNGDLKAIEKVLSLGILVSETEESGDDESRLNSKDSDIINAYVASCGSSGAVRG
ncbi:MAG: DUF5681 domain-containing protein [Pseudomonadota bacterium]